ncbi:glutamate receptor 2-like [Tribolium madens]|uniref:glutamate receptor 2-like n=1 Tax=Tribolium madens TaxID=41895 RepID=UPI001CF7670A|nr:glutamate receptor 2-like [Tribolium madens]
MTQTGFYKNDVDALKKWSNRHYLVLDFRGCQSSEKIIYELNRTNIFVYSLRYLFFVSVVDFPAFALKLNDYQLLPNVEVVCAIFDGESVFLHQPYKVGKINELMWENYGNWSLAGGLFERYATIPTPQRRANLHHANLVVVIVIYENDTWNHLTDYRNPGVDTFTKQDFESMKCVFEHLNINYSLTGVDSYGYYDKETKKFSGLVREIQRGKADVSGVSIYFTEDRYAAVDLIKMGNPLAIRFIVKKPSTSYIKNIFFITFNKNVWIASIVIMLITAIVVKVILGWEVKTKKKVKQNSYSLSDVTLIALEAVCQQGTTTEPQSLSGRILVLIFFAAFLFIYVSYSANIVVLLQSTTKINDIQELLESRIQVGGCQTHYMKNYFEVGSKTSIKKGPLQKLYLKKIYPDQYFPLESGMKKLQQGNFAFHVLLQAAYVYILKNFTNYEIFKYKWRIIECFLQENRGYVAVPKHSPYKDLFKVAILKVDEYGLQRRTNLRIIMKPKCFSQSATFKSVGFYDCEQVLWIWVFGTILALAFFAAEVFFDKFLASRLGARVSKNFT